MIKPAIPADMLASWLRIVDLAARVIGVPSSLVTLGLSVSGLGEPFHPREETGGEVVERIVSRYKHRPPGGRR